MNEETDEHRLRVIRVSEAMLKAITPIVTEYKLAADEAAGLVFSLGVSLSKHIGITDAEMITAIRRRS